MGAKVSLGAARGRPYFAASTDTAEKNAEFAKSVGADYPILSDPERKAARAFGVASAIKPIAWRWTFFIGKDGKILAIGKKVTPANYAADVAEKLKQLGVAKR